jgi:hypothetical protein
MPTVEYDIGFFQAGVSELKAYLLSDLLFWPLSIRPPSGGVPFPSLTLGGLLLARARLDALIPSGASGDLADLDLQIEAIRQKWGAAWARKANWELSSRLNQWQNFLEEYRRDPDTQAGYFAQEVGLRVILMLLMGDNLTVDEGTTSLLKALDSLLKTVFTAGNFIWDPALRAGFPSDPYWFLYGRLKEQLLPR